MIRFEFSSVRSRDIEGSYMVQVRQQAWTEKLCILSTCSLYFGVFCISKILIWEGGLIKTQVLLVRYKGSVPHLTPADSPAFLSSPLSDESCVSTPKWQKEQREKTKGRNETQLHIETTGNKVTWACWIQMSLSTWNSRRMRSTAVQASRETGGWTRPQAQRLRQISDWYQKRSTQAAGSFSRDDACRMISSTSNHQAQNWTDKRVGCLKLLLMKKDSCTALIQESFSKSEEDELFSSKPCISASHRSLL